MATINIGRVQHAVSAQVDDEVANWELTAGEELVSNEVAAAIAGWFSSPLPLDRPYLELAQLGKTTTSELGQSILRDQQVTSLNMSADAHRCLAALDAWTAQFETV